MTNTTTKYVLSEDIAKQEKILTEQQAVRTDSLIDYCLNAITDKCTDRSTEVMSIRNKVKNPNAEIKQLIAAEIERCAEDKLITPDYNLKNKARQDVWLFIGTHWIIISQSQLLHFVKETSKKIGLPDDLYNNPNFMESLQEHITFRFSNPMPTMYSSSLACINTQNGTIEIDYEGHVKLRKHNSNDGFTYVLPYSYDANATCEKWQQFLDEMLPDRDTQDTMGEFCGYTLTSDIKGEKMLVFYGTGGNGKSVALEVISAVIGKENTSNVSLSSLTKDGKTRALINNKRMNVSYESDRDIDPSILKSAVSGEPLNAYINYVGPITMTHYAKFITSFNIMPKAENTYGFYRRFIIIPWEQTVDKSKKNLNLAKQIIATELPGILNWMIERLCRFLKNGDFTISKVCEEAMEKYKLKSDSVLLFIHECCDIVSESATEGKKLFDQYKEYCIGSDIRNKGKQKFFDQLEACGAKRITRQNNIIFKSIKLKENVSI